MFYLHFYNISRFSYSRFSYLWALVLILPLVACSSGSSNSGGTGSNLNAPNASTLYWVAPSEREDGTGLNLSDIKLFRVYYGTRSGDYSNVIDINDPTAGQMALASIPSGTYYVAVTAVDRGERESALSSEVVVAQ